MVAGIVLLALGMKKTLEHANDPLETVPAAALVGGVATYLLAIVAFRWRLLHTLGRPRLIAAAALLGLLPLAVEIPAYATVATRGRRRLGTYRLRGRALRRFPPERAAGARTRGCREVRA